MHYRMAKRRHLGVLHKPSKGRGKPPTGRTLRRQWNLLQQLWASQRGFTINELVATTGVVAKTIRRDLILLRQVGFRLEETIHAHGCKRWRIPRPQPKAHRGRRGKYGICGNASMRWSRSQSGWGTGGLPRRLVRFGRP